MIDENIFMEFYFENVSKDVQEAQQEFFYFSRQIKEFYDEYKIKDKKIDKNSAYQQLAFIYANIWSNISRCTFLKDEDNANNIAVGVVTASISNDLLAIISLASDGLDYQAMNIVRNLYELGLLLINICVDEEKRAIYIETAKKENSYMIWKKYFRVKSMIETLKSISNDDSIANEIEEIYHRLSQFVHNSMLNVYIFNYNKPYNEDEKRSLNIGAHYVTRSDSILEETVEIIWIFTRIFGHIVQERKYAKSIGQLFENDNMGLYKDANNGSRFAEYYYFKVRNIVI